MVRKFIDWMLYRILGWPKCSRKYKENKDGER